VRVAQETKSAAYAFPAPCEVPPELLAPWNEEDEALAALLAPFAGEFAKLQQALRKSHESEHRFVKKCRELAGGITEADDKLRQLEASSREQQQQLTQLSEEEEQSRQTQSQIQAEIMERRERIKTLRGDLARLNKRVEDSVEELALEQKAAVGAAEGHLEERRRTREQQAQNLAQRRQESAELQRQLEAALEEQHAAEREEEAVESKLLEVNAEIRRQQRAQGDLERQVKAAQGQCADSSAQLEAKAALLARSKGELEVVEKQLKTAEVSALDRMRIGGRAGAPFCGAARSHPALQGVLGDHKRKLEELSSAEVEASRALESAKQDNAHAEAHLHDETQKLETTRANLHAAVKEERVWKKKLQLMLERVREMEHSHHELDSKKTDSAERLQALKDKVMVAQAKLRGVAKQLDTCVREREVLAQSHASKVDACKRHETAVRIAKSTLRNVRNEYQGALATIRSLARTVDRLRRERAAHEADLNRRQAQKANAEEEALQRKQRSAAVQKQIEEDEARLRQQQNMLETVRVDRAKYCKLLLEHKAEMKEHQRRFNALNLQIKQLKHEVSDKDMAFVSEHVHLEHVSADLSGLKQQNQGDAARISELDDLVRQQSEQIAKLAAVIAHADEEMRQQTKEYDAVAHEQRVLNRQLIARNEELAQLYESLKLQRSVLHKNELHYREQGQALVQWRDTRKQLRSALDEIGNDSGEYEALKASIAATQRELIREQLKAKALSEELNKSVNIHRWRQLLDKDAAAYQLVRNVQQLQSTLIKKAAEVEEKDAVIQEKERLYVELRRVLARQPGAETVEQLQIYEATIKDKRAKLKAMRDDLAFYQARTRDLAFDLRKLDQQLQLLKLDYFERRRRESASESRHTGASSVLPSRTDSAPLDLEQLRQLGEPNGATTSSAALPPPPSALADVPPSARSSESSQGGDFTEAAQLQEHNQESAGDRRRPSLRLDLSQAHAIASREQAEEHGLVNAIADAAQRADV
jgi:chromosome segregation ATPase